MYFTTSEVKLLRFVVNSFSSGATVPPTQTTGSSANNATLIGNVTANNAALAGILTGNVATMTGNVTASYFFGNGSQLVGVTSTLPTTVPADLVGNVTGTKVTLAGNATALNFAGNLVVVPRDQVEPLKVSTTDLMTFIVSGGVSGLGIEPEPVGRSSGGRRGRTLVGIGPK